MVKQQIHDENACPGQTDEQLARLAQQGFRDAEEELIKRYTRLVRICARPYYLAGGDGEDLIQEGMIGLVSAVREYSREKDAAFGTFAEVCIRRRLYSAIKSASRAKHGPLNDYVSLESTFFDYSVQCDADYLFPRALDPEQHVLLREKTREFYDGLSGLLSGFEARILGLYLQGLSYQEIATMTKRSPKSVDNAAQRVRKKLSRYLNHGESR